MLHDQPRRVGRRFSILVVGVAFLAGCSHGGEKGDGSAPPDGGQSPTDTRVDKGGGQADVAACVNSSEAASALTRDRRRKVDDLWLDLRHAPWRRRAQLLREHVLPPADYVRARFGGPAPVAYAKRFLLGVRKWL